MPPGHRGGPRSPGPAARGPHGEVQCCPHSTQQTSLGAFPALGIRWVSLQGGGCGGEQGTLGSVATQRASNGHLDESLCPGRGRLFGRAGPPMSCLSMRALTLAVDTSVPALHTTAFPEAPLTVNRVGPREQHCIVDGAGQVPVTRTSACPCRDLHSAAPRQDTAVWPETAGVASSSSRESSCLCSLPLRPGGRPCWPA